MIAKASSTKTETGFSKWSFFVMNSPSNTDSSNTKETPTKEAITRLLQSSQVGDKEAVNQLLPLVYDEMSNIAHQKLKFERSGHTLDTTALVHEAYFKLINHDKVEWKSRAHFLAIAALSMKRILINYAKRKQAIKRGGEYSRADIELERIEGPSQMNESMAEEILALDKALERMQTFNERGSKVVDYHFFGGLTWKEISEVMGIAPITVRRAWYSSRLWLRRELMKSELPNISLNRPA
ncbi:ECF-type sigma factor [Fodinibius halophilus]|uniref:Sigma-70 family RNA polymerase sigma factor n=1 Tax=Fodinibius halophilus TaxID=1736908 RepID=A0A6M1TNU5_9BACT|nr:ECF-type sigma factor [Fodinibius halophilus]NGP90000.1 sigma-70 family RNA polymerase sigma factor [Fodinibius halophilus]